MKYSVFTMMFYISLTNAENIAIISSVKNEVILKNQDKIINKNFREMDKMTQLINQKIQKIESLKKEINLLIVKRDEKVICATIKSLIKDINDFKDEIKTIENVTEKEKIENKLKTYNVILDEEKAKLVNSQCVEVER